MADLFGGKNRQAAVINWLPSAINPITLDFVTINNG